MNIAQALKEKNRITGRIVNLQNLIVKYNRTKSNETPVENVAELWDKLLFEKASLSKIKAQIQQANCGIAEDLVNLSEAKAMLTFLTNNLEAACGVSGATENVYDRKTGEYIKSDYTIDFVLDIKQVRSQIDKYQSLIENLQDRVDAYNATTSI
jgi:hypothetical protein